MAPPPVPTEPAQPPATESDPAVETDPDPAEPADKVADIEAEAAPEWELELSGRVYARDTLGRVDGGAWQHTRGLDQARFQARYERDNMRMNLEVDFAGGDADLKDTYIRVEPSRHVEVNVGRFKVPMSYIGLESKWSLPAIERGLLSEIEADGRGVPFAGDRGDGLSIEFRPRTALDPRFIVAAFQSALPAGVTGLDPTEDFNQDVYARIQIEPISALRVASSLATTGRLAESGVADSFEHGFFGSLEAYLETDSVRLWLEGFAGESLFPQIGQPLSGSFWAARALAAYRIRKPVSWTHRIDPFIGASIIEPTDDRADDRVSEVTGGLMWGFSKHLRLQAELSRRIAEGLSSPIADGTVIRLQLSAAFEEQVH